MKRLLFIFVAFIFTTCYAQNDSTKILNLISYLERGETLYYSVTKTRIDSSSTKEPKTTEAAFNFKITVKDSTDSNYVISYYRTADVFSNPKLIELPEEMQKKLIDLSTIKFDYETDEMGTFKGILNEHILAEKIASDFKELKDIFTTENSNEQLKNFMEEFVGSVDPNSLIALYAQDIQALHYALGASFNPQDTIPFEEEVIAPIFNIPLTLKGILYCEEYDEENDYFSLVEEKTMEGNFVDKMLEFLKKHENKENPIKENELKDLKMDIYFHNTYQYNSHYGVATYIELYKEITVDGKDENMKRIDIYEISLVEE
ncbi:hypothetical protein [Sphingobacterium composti Ten et al. 2007 non Yoo et al. 2007]|uniref:hypothetical protein n=1 Tax=Sphingobacterium composti TaxID=363260 RepID=UPI00135C90FE|nr:hypothetical protein [Sphingobacterium composti Ten et al. 2007 non Yoo et al. 2007]